MHANFRIPFIIWKAFCSFTGAITNKLHVITLSV